MRSHLHHNFKNVNRNIDRIRACDITGGLATAAIIGTVAAGGFSMYGQMQAGRATQRRNEYEAQLAERQSELVRRTAEQNKTIEQNKAATESKLLAGQTAELMGKQKATIAANKIGGGSVTAADIAADTIQKSEMDQMAIRYGADLASWSIEEEAKGNEWMLKNRARQYRQAGKNAVTAGDIGAISTLLNTATSVADASYYRNYGFKRYPTKID